MRAANSDPPSRRHPKETGQPFAVPDLPLPTPPPMANLTVTSRFDLQTQGGYNYRRILNSASTEFGRSPLLGRKSAFRNAAEGFGGGLRPYGGSTLPKKFGSVHEQLGHSPILRHKNYEDLSRSTNFDFLDRGSVSSYDLKNYESEPRRPLIATSSSKYFSKDSLLSQEMEEVRNLSRELSTKFGEYNYDQRQRDYNHEQQTVFYNDHYMSDIDENEEIKEFYYGYAKQNRRNSDEIARNIDTKKPVSYNTLPTLSSHKYCKISHTSASEVHREHAEVFEGSLSSFKSSDFCGYSPEIGSDNDYYQEQAAKIMKTPYRPVVKIAKVRLVVDIMT